jgi:acetylglutamate kinase
MIPKVEAGLRAAAAGVPAAIIDGREAGALRRLLGGGEEAGAGTVIG